MKPKRKPHVRRRKLNRFWTEVSTGMDKIEFGTPDEIIRDLNPVWNEFTCRSPKEICKTFLAEAKIALKGNPKGHRAALAHAVELNLDVPLIELQRGLPSSSKDWPDNVFHEFTHVIQKAMVGAYFACRLRLIEKERAAWHGEQAMKGSKKTGKQAKRGSVRAYLQEHFPDWRTKPVLQLARKLKAQAFQGRTLENLRRAIQKAKK